MTPSPINQARHLRRRQFGQLYLAALIVTLIPHTAAWTLPNYLAAKSAAISIAAADRDLAHGRLDAAIDGADRALALQPSSEQALGIKMSALIERYWEKKAESDLEDARQLGEKLAYSRDGAALVARGNLALVEMDAARAVTLMTEAVGLNPASAYIQHQLGFALKEAKRPDGALIRLKRALELSPDMAWVQSNLAAVLAAMERCGETMPGLKTAARAACHETVGIAKHNAGKFRDARRDLERAVQLAPTNGGYHANYASALLNTGDRPAALQHATRAKALGITDHPVFGPLGIR